jgi:uncharacterized protein YndB with AHSA1/START domain
LGEEITMSTDSPIQVRVARRLSASAERVFDAWLDAEKAGKWLFATPTGQMVRAEIDARVGGAFVFVDRREGEDFEHVGEYLEIDRPRRLVFVFGLPKLSPDRDQVTIEIVALETGCELTLTHELNPSWAEHKDSTEAAWTMILEGLVATVG